MTMSTPVETIFSKIIRREIPASIVYENEYVLAFRDVNPQAPVHVLVIPKKPIRDVTAAAAEDRALMGELLLAAAEVARLEGIAESGYRLVINNGPHAQQTVFHLHLHVMGGRGFTWPPG